MDLRPRNENARTECALNHTSGFEVINSFLEDFPEQSQAQGSSSNLSQNQVGMNDTTEDEDGEMKGGEEQDHVNLFCTPVSSPVPAPRKQ